MCDTALEIGCLVLVDDTDLCELVYHSIAFLVVFA